jgi:hypothetical protein
VEEKEAVINRTNHANARRCAAQREGGGGGGWRGKGGGGWRCWVPIPIWGGAWLDSVRFDGVSTLLFLFCLSLSSSDDPLSFTSLVCSLSQL